MKWHFAKERNSNRGINWTHVFYYQLHSSLFWNYTVVSLPLPLSLSVYWKRTRESRYDSQLLVHVFSLSFTLSLSLSVRVSLSLSDARFDTLVKHGYQNIVDVIHQPKRY